jgi:hypothetical protein
MFSHGSENLVLRTSRRGHRRADARDDDRDGEFTVFQPRPQTQDTRDAR